MLTREPGMLIDNFRPLQLHYSEQRLMITTIMRLLCVTRHGEKLVGIILFSVLFDVETIRLYVFDSPAALQNILFDEMSPVGDLTDIYLRKYKELDCLTQNLNHMAKEMHSRILHRYCRLHNKNLINCLKLFENIHKLNVRNKTKQKSSPIRTNFFIKDSSDDVFNGAVHGLLLLQHVYDIDFSNLLTEDEYVKNASIISHKISSRFGRTLIYQDLLLLSIHAVTVAWYGNAIRILNIAAKHFQSHSSLKGKMPLSHHFIVPYLTFVAKGGILMQQNDPTFDIGSRLLPFSTSRFDHGNCYKY